MSLSAYKNKRNFKHTPEPASKKAKSSSTLRFVVQRHHATSLHYDFRLEMDGVLKSWAVPKGPSLNPADKRLAMMVEDHPFDYSTFEGEIPAGNYGAGTVTIFDEGTYGPINGAKATELKKGLSSGNLKFTLKGRLLKGEFALVKLKDADQNAWLLIKHRDEFATDQKFNSEDLVSAEIKKLGKEFKKNSSNRKSNPPEEPLGVNQEPSKKVKEIPYKPMLAKLAPAVFDDDNWVYEKKLDGYRALAYTGKKVTLVSRNGIDFTRQYQPVTDALANLGRQAVIDGELVIENNAGKSNFQALQNYEDDSKLLKLKYYVFDLLYLDGHDLRQMELVKRKQVLKALLSALNNQKIIYNDHLAGFGSKLLDDARKHGWEGIIAKQATGSYENNRRTSSWLKIKLNQSQEVLICGFTKPAGSRKYFGALVLGMNVGGKLTYIGNCGTGFSGEVLKDLHSRMMQLKTEKKPFPQKAHLEKNITWVKPELVAEVVFTEWTEDEHLRHPVYKGLRSDKIPAEVKKEKPTTQPSSQKPASVKQKPLKQADEQELAFGSKKVKLSNLNKLYWKNEGISKGQLLTYYQDVAPYILPYLKNKPLSLNRHPNGIDAPGFFQKDLDTEHIPAWIKYAPLHSESNNKTIDYLICNNEATLLWMANLGCIEINPWLSTYSKPDNPQFAVIDLDPQDVDFKTVIEAALVTKEILERMKLVPFIKTSGSRGLHIFIHTAGRYEYDVTRLFAEYVAKLVNGELPDTTSIVRNPAKRRKLIYLDFLQNRRGQTIAAPFSVRPKPGATVSTTLTWDEVNNNLNVKDFTIFNTIDRLKQKDDPWKNLFASKADLKTALKMLK